MKKVLLKFLCAGLALIIFSAHALAYSSIATAISDAEISAVTNFDETEIYSAFTDVEQLISYVTANEGITYNDLEANNSEMISNITSSSMLALASSSDSPPIFSAFIWGCLLNWVGVLIVGITTGFDGQQIVKSLWGCLLSSCLLGGSYGWYYYGAGYY
jgi:hypothetical protein